MGFFENQTPNIKNGKWIGNDAEFNDWDNTSCPNPAIFIPPTGNSVPLCQQVADNISTAYNLCFGLNVSGCAGVDFDETAKIAYYRSSYDEKNLTDNAGFSTATQQNSVKWWLIFLIVGGFIFVILLISALIVAARKKK